MSKWRKIRISLYAVIFVGSFIQALLEQPSPASEFVLEWQIMALFMFFPALAIPFGIFVQSGAPYVAEKWTITTLDTKFFSFSDPLHFFHFASHCFGLAGVSVITVSVFHDPSQIDQGVTYILFSIGLFLGVKLCIKIFRRKYEK